MHKSYKVILLKFAVASGIEEAPMVCLELLCMAAVQMIIQCILLPTELKHKCNARTQLLQELSVHVYSDSDSETLKFI